MKVTQAFLPVEINYTPMCESKNTDKNVCATTDPQKQAQVKDLEKQIDQLVYDLYDLTEEEIVIIEGEGNGQGT